MIGKEPNWFGDAEKISRSSALQPEGSPFAGSASGEKKGAPGRLPEAGGEESCVTEVLEQQSLHVLRIEKEVLDAGGLSASGKRKAMPSSDQMASTSAP